MFDLESGALCLDFANTVDWHNSDHPDDALKDYSVLIEWGRAAGILASDQAEKLGQVAKNQSKEAIVAYESAMQLRESVYRIFANYSEQESVDLNDLGILNRALSKSLSHLHINLSDRGFDWEFTESPNGLDQIVWPVARSAGELLVSDRLNRVRQCADDRGCGYLFIDTSRNRSRLWCSMESCGNRAKARRHYLRKQKKKTAYKPDASKTLPGGN
ncbi:MAG: hypothetical protein GY796_26810 [Chloroflexi bacterium]|nr:hypothetical protein [Chloroflexota bacterium]